MIKIIIKNITDTLATCGCKPTAQTQNGETIIKVNAPTVPTAENGNESRKGAK